MKPTLLLHVAAAMLLAAVPPAGARTVEPPASFGIRTTGSQRPVHYSEHAGYLPNPIDRAAIEAVCRTGMESGTAQRIPEFGPGFDEPGRTRSVKFTTPDAAQTASYTEITTYACDDPNTLRRSGPCACNYRRQTEHRVEIDLWQAGRLNRWNATLETAKGKHEIITRPTPVSMDKPHADAVGMLFGPVIGSGSAAGFKCELRELVSGKTIKQTCLALSGPRLPEIYWGRALSTDSRVIDEPRARTGSAMQRLEVGVEVDTGVFDPPAGIAYGEHRLPPPKKVTP